MVSIGEFYRVVSWSEFTWLRMAQVAAWTDCTENGGAWEDEEAETSQNARDDVAWTTEAAVELMRSESMLDTLWKSAWQETLWMWGVRGGDEQRTTLRFLAWAAERLKSYVLKRNQKVVGGGQVGSCSGYFCVCVVDILLVRGLSEFSGMMRMIYVSFWVVVAWGYTL